jgi:exopolysaccharide production protein ExoQ
MNGYNPSNASETSAAQRRWLWLAIVLVGAAFFFVVHNFQVSRYADFAPWSDTVGSLEAGQNATKGLALSLIGLLGLYLLLKGGGRPLHLTGSLAAMMIFYLAWAAASVLWSADPGMSCRRLAVLLFCVLGAAGFARQFAPRDLALMAMVVTGGYLLIGVATEIALGTFRPWAAGYRFAGTVHPNTQGMQLTVFSLASFCLARSAKSHRIGLWTLFAVGVAFLLLTRSRTSCAATAIALAALWLVSVSRRTRILTLLGAGLLISTTLLIATLLGVDVYDSLIDATMLGRQEQSETLTGRIPIWMELRNYIAARPLTGYGYESFWTSKRIEAVSDELEWPLREAHNTFVDTLLSVGLVGLAAFLAAALLGVRRAALAYRETGEAGFALTFCLLIACLVDACLESGGTSANCITLLVGTGVVALFTRSSACSERSTGLAGNGRLEVVQVAR